MRLSPLAAIAAACVLTLTACGDDGSDPESSDSSESPSASSSSDAPGKDKKGKGKKDENEPADDATSEGPERPDLPGTVCSEIAANDISEIVGSDVEMGDISGRGCVLRAKKGSAPNVNLNQVPLATVGGAGGVEDLLNAFGEVEAEEVPDVGDRALVGVGTGVSAGVVVVDKTIVQVNLFPKAKASEEDTKQQTVELLELVAGTL